MPELSILICSITSRAKLLERLLNILNPQIEAAGDAVELLIDCDDAQVSIGAKRQRLLERSNPDSYAVAFVDDDDLVSDQYISLILKALQSKPDVVGIRMDRYILGDYHGCATYSIHCQRTHTNENGHQVWTREPSHLCVTRRDIALRIGFLPLNVGEDTDYAKRLMDSGLLKTEVMIDEPIYTYLYWPHALRKELTHKIKTGAK